MLYHADVIILRCNLMMFWGISRPQAKVIEQGLITQVRLVNVTFWRKIE